LASFSPNGNKLITFGGDEDNTFGIYDWLSQNLIASQMTDK